MNRHKRAEYKDPKKHIRKRERDKRRRQHSLKKKETWDNYSLFCRNAHDARQVIKQDLKRRLPVFTVYVIDDTQGVLRYLEGKLAVEGVSIEYILNTSEVIAKQFHDFLLALPPPEVLMAETPGGLVRTNKLEQGEDNVIGVITDLNMPLRGEKVERICQRKGIPCLVHSSNSTKTRVEKYNIEGINNWLSFIYNEAVERYVQASYY